MVKMNLKMLKEKDNMVKWLPKNPLWNKKSRYLACDFRGISQIQ